MAVATAVREKEKQKTGKWSSVFPQDQLSETQSQLFVKKLLAVAVSNITYLRVIFPEHAFGDRCLEDLNLKILRDDSTCPGACRLIKWMKGCFDALDKKYLRTVILGIFVNADDPESLIESYTFKFAYQNRGGMTIYRNDKKLASAYSDGETKKATICLLRTIILLTQTLDPLPDGVFMTMKLLYYDDVTPPDYEPPGFKPAESDKFNYDIEPMNLKVGDVKTPFHIVKLRLTTDGSLFAMKDGEGHEKGEEEVDDEKDGNETLVNTSGLDQDEEKDLDEVMQEVDDGISLELESLNQETIEENKEDKKKKGDEPAVSADVPDGSPAKPGATETASTPASQVSNMDNDEKCITRCPCGCNEEDGLMVNCEGCNYWQHAICFGMLEEDEVPDIHICDLCADANIPERKPTDYTLYGMKPVCIQAMCLWRRALLACTETSRITIPHFSKRLGVEYNVATGLVNRLQKEKFVSAPNKGKRLGKIVRKDKVIEEGFKMYCHRASEPEDLEEIQATKENSPKQQSSVKDRSSQKRKSYDEVEELTEKASAMDVSEKQSASKKIDKPKRLQQLRSQQQVRQSPRIQKRKFEESRKIVSISDQSEYEISNSQEVDDFPVSKRRKASTVTKNMMV